LGRTTYQELRDTWGVNIGPLGTPEAFAGSKTPEHPYTYAESNPVNGVDPAGLQSCRPGNYCQHHRAPCPTHGYTAAAKGSGAKGSGGANGGSVDSGNKGNVIPGMPSLPDATGPGVILTAGEGGSGYLGGDKYKYGPPESEMPPPGSGAGSGPTPNPWGGTGGKSGPSAPIAAPGKITWEDTWPCIEKDDGSFSINWEVFPAAKGVGPPFVGRPYLAPICAKPGHEKHPSCCRSDYYHVYVDALRRKCKDCFEGCHKYPWQKAEGPVDDPSVMTNFGRCIRGCMRNASDAKYRSSINAHQEFKNAVKACARERKAAQ